MTPERALVFAPLGRDGDVACAMLREAGIEGVNVGSLRQLLEPRTGGAGFAILNEDPLRTDDIHPHA